jgi:UDP-N-acetylglucosamine 2-epimerase (non-hydrolysing)
MKILSVVGARPNFMKIAPFVAAVSKHNDAQPQRRVEHVLVHSGQHYDPTLSERFFQELDIPPPQHHLNVGSGSHAYQLGTTMIKFEEVLLAERPDWVVVVGDVNAACACALTARKHLFKVAHIEAGLRSHDWEMPEETNRVVADRVSNLLFTTCRFADANLAREGFAAEQVAMVGNIMIDTLEAQRARAQGRNLDEIVGANTLEAAGEPPVSLYDDAGFGVLTLHRPSNVDDAATLGRNLELVVELSQRLPIVFPVHPRTLDRFKQFGLWPRLAASRRLLAVKPLGYVDLLALTMSARLFLTDSGGIQEECCVLGTPCLTLRPNTERPATLAENGGTNHLIGSDPQRVREAFDCLLGTARSPHRPPCWDGQTAERILERLLQM